MYTLKQNVLKRNNKTNDHCLNRLAINVYITGCSISTPCKNLTTMGGYYF